MIDIIKIVILSIVFMVLLFIDQTNEFLRLYGRPVLMLRRMPGQATFYRKITMMAYDAFIYAKAYFIIYAEFIFPP